MIPMELVTMGASTLGAGVMSLVAMRMRMKAQAHTQLMAKADMVHTNRMESLTQVPSQVQWTRRVIALTVIFSVMVLPKLAVLLFPTLPITYGWTSSTGGSLWGLLAGTEVLQWQEVRGLAITPLDTHFTAMVAGLYFGPSIVK